MESSTFARWRCEPYDVPSDRPRLRRILEVLAVPSVLRRLLRAAKYAAKEEHFAAVAGAAVALILVGTMTYSLGEGWNVVDGFYFAVCTLTTSSIADPSLTLTHESLKLFTALFVLTGIGILVELARELGVGYVREREDRHAARHTRRHKEDPPETQSAG
jgi:hypothetical protein